MKKTTLYKLVKQALYEVYKEKRGGILKGSNKLLDKIKKEVFIPLCCPKCSKVMKHWLDKDNYKVHKKCHDCVIEFEHKLKIKEEYYDYEKSLELKNNLSILDKTEAYLLDMVNSSNNGYVSEQGDIERWVGGIDKEKMIKDIKGAAKIRRKSIQENSND